MDALQKFLCTRKPQLGFALCNSYTSLVLDNFPVAYVQNLTDTHYKPSCSLGTNCTISFAESFHPNQGLSNCRTSDQINSIVLEGIKTDNLTIMRHCCFNFSLSLSNAEYIFFLQIREFLYKLTSNRHHDISRNLTKTKPFNSDHCPTIKTAGRWKYIVDN